MAGWAANTSARMTYQRDEGSPVFSWHGGAYIDIGYFDSTQPPGVDGDTFHAYDVINVWDYKNDEPRIERTLAAFQAACDEWLDENEECPECGAVPQGSGNDCVLCGEAAGAKMVPGEENE